MQIQLIINVPDNDETRAMVENFTTAQLEDEGITIKTAGGTYDVDLDAVQVNY